MQLKQSCIAVVQCHTDLAIRNGIVKFSKDHNSVTYWCVTGFNRVGSSSATCKEDGTWSSPPPKCTTGHGKM